MHNILIATRNVNKKKELKKILTPLKGIRIVGLNDLPFDPPIIIENGKTFWQNAVKKAVTLSEFFNGMVLADDSGLCVKALDGKPGVRSARFARTSATDSENNEKLLKLMEKVPETDREAEFVCVITLARAGRLLASFEGRAQGTIGYEPKGKGGFGYDPLFIPDGYKKTYAEMKGDFKNRISHRAAALKKMRKDIKTYLKCP